MALSTTFRRPIARLLCLRDAAQREIVGLGAAGREDDLGRLGRQ